MEKITKLKAWDLLATTENSLLGASGSYSLQEIENKLNDFHGDTFQQSRGVTEFNKYRIKFDGGSTLYFKDFSKAYKHNDYLILEKQNDYIVYQLF